MKILLEYFYFQIFASNLLNPIITKSNLFLYSKLREWYFKFKGNSYSHYFSHWYFKILYFSLSQKVIFELQRRVSRNESDTFRRRNFIIWVLFRNEDYTDSWGQKKNLEKLRFYYSLYYKIYFPDFYTQILNRFSSEWRIYLSVSFIYLKIENNTLFHTKRIVLSRKIFWKQMKELVYNSVNYSCHIQMNLQAG